MRRDLALAAVAALLVALACCAQDLRRRLQARADREPLHRRSAALVGPALSLRRCASGSLSASPGVADTNTAALGERAE